MREEKKPARERVVILGGGFSGVEVVAELNDFVREAARSYRQIDASEIRVVLLHAGARILPEVTEKLGLFAQRILRKRKVEIHAREHSEPRQEVFCQGDLGDRVYIIVRGRVEVLREEGGRTIKLAALGPGEYFGEMAVLGDTTRNATVRWVEPLDVVSLPKREFMLVTSNLPDARREFGEVVRRRRRATALAFGQQV